MLDFFSQKNRILLREMVKTDFKLRYQGSLIGHLWSILKPLMLFTIMYLVFVRFLRFDDGTPHYAIGLLIGMVTWSFFSEATSMGMMSIVSRGDLLLGPQLTILLTYLLSLFLPLSMVSIFHLAG